MFIRFTLKDRHTTWAGMFLLILSFGSLFVGVLPLSFNALITGSSDAWSILLTSRLPRLCAIILTGSSLAISGMMMQKVTRNRFVSPSTAVTMDAARMGILIALIVFPGASLLHKTLLAYGFAILGTALFLRLLRLIPLKNVVFIPLLGIMVGTMIESITTFLALKFDLMQALGGMMTGSFTQMIAGRYELLFTAVPLLLCALFAARKFDILSLGDDFARNLGLKPKSVMNLALVLVSLLTASVVVTVGTLPFIGLIVPNMVAMRYGSSNSFLLCGLYGSCLVLVCDLIARIVIFPYELPVGFILGIVGSLGFLGMIRHEF